MKLRSLLDRSTAPMRWSPLLLVLGMLLIRVTGAVAGAPGPEPEIESESEVEVEVEVETEIAPQIEIEPEPPIEIQARPSAAPPLDPAARLLQGSAASEYWNLYIELESGHRITQRFLVTNAGPGDHTAVALGHLMEPGREPYRYANGRQRARWTLSADRLFFDIAASHIDLHRPTGELRISKDDIEIQLFFDFAPEDPAASMPAERLPRGYAVDVLAVAAPTRGTLRAPWMTEPIETTGRTWLAHTWTRDSEAEVLDRRVDLFGGEGGDAFYAIELRRGKRFESAWSLSRAAATDDYIEPEINIPASWVEIDAPAGGSGGGPYPLPDAFQYEGPLSTGLIHLGSEWLRFDPLEVIPQPFRWFIRRMTQPQEVWADARIDVTLFPTPGSPPLPPTGESTTRSAARFEQETERETAKRSVTGVASITFLNPIDQD